MGLGEFISNVLFCSVFALAGINHAIHWEEELPKLQAVGIPADIAPICLGFAIGFLILGSLLILCMQFEIFGYICYIGFLIPVTWFMHIVPLMTASYNKTDVNSKDIVQLHMIHTMKNISLIGACFKFVINEFDKANKYVNEKKKGKKKKNKQSKKKR
eukprot:288928_1